MATIKLDLSRMIDRIEERKNKLEKDLHNFELEVNPHYGTSNLMQFYDLRSRVAALNEMCILLTCEEEG